MFALGASDGRGGGAGGGGDRGSGEPSQPDDRGNGAGNKSKAHWDIDDEEFSGDSSDIDIGVLTSIVVDDGSNPEEVCRSDRRETCGEAAGVGLH